MVELDERVLSEARTRNTLSVDDLLRRVEQYHTTEKPGTPEDTLIEYARALADTSVSFDARSDALNERDIEFSGGMVRRELDERLTNTESWNGEKALYAVGDGRVSVYPTRWHDALGETTDLTECITFIQDASAFQEARGIGTEEGVSEGIVFDVATVIGELEPDEAAARLEEQKERGEIIEDATTGPSGGLKPRDAAESGASELPPVIDIRDALDDIEASTEPDVSDEIDGIRESLAEFSERDRAGQDSILSDIERRIIGLREQLGDNADRRAEGILNRIQTYRDTSADDSATLSLSGGALLNSENDPVDVTDHHGGVATLDGTLVNGGDTRKAVAILTMYTDDGKAIKTIETRTVSLDPDERSTIEQTIYVPENASSYTVAAFDADDGRAIDDGRPES
jgi:hypothetical protein